MEDESAKSHVFSPKSQVTAVPQFGFKVKFNHVFPEKRNQNLRPKISQIWPMAGLFLR